MARRIKILRVILSISFLAITGRLFYWQIIEAERLTTLANQQYQTSFEIQAERGKIFSSDNFPLVLNKKSYLVYVNPQLLKVSPEELTKSLELYWKDPQIDLSKSLNRKLQWVPLIKNLDEEGKNKIDKLKIDGLGFEEGKIRFYPEGSMSAQLLGFVAENAESGKKGYFGLEGYYENELKGKPGWRSFNQDALGRPIPFAESWEEKPVSGRDLYLNIDRAIQYSAENHLKEGLKEYEASSGSVLVMNPQNGAVLAMASFPAFDLREYYKDDPELYKNPLISSVFEPGSIFKVIIMATAIDSGAVKADEKCPLCQGPRLISNYLIKTWNDKYYPNSTMEDIIVHSDNIGMVYVAEKIGINKLYEYLKFFFGELTNIDLQGEVGTVLKDKKEWRPIDLATVSFGQGIAVTPIQVLTAVSAIAAGGELFQPQVVQRISDNRQMISIKSVKKSRPISEKTARIITEMMVKAVEKGEAKWAKPEGYRIAGKTGTAQIPIAGHYDPEKTIASFVGFAPAEKPLFSMLVILNEPKKSPWGSETAAPLWFEIAKDIFRIKRIAPNY